MSVYLSPVGLAAAAVVNTLNVLVTIKERLCWKYNVNATNQPTIAVTYTNGTPVLNGTTVFVPITASVTITTPDNNCSCNPHVQTFTERFVTAFQGYTALPTAVAITVNGRDQFPTCVNSCSLASAYVINDSLTITITPPAA